MGNEQIKIIHLDTENTWRGGQQQAVYLFEGMLNRGYDTLMICPPGSKLESYCRQRHLPYHSLRFINEFDYITSIKTALISKRFGAEILQLHSGHSVSWGLWTKLFRSDLKLVATRRVTQPINKTPLSIIKYKTNLLNSIVCISEEVKRVLINNGIQDSKLKVIYSGIDTKRFDSIQVADSFRKDWGVPETAILIGTIAAFTNEKDYNNLLTAASNLIKTNPNLYFMLVGDGELLEAMKIKAKHLNISDKIVFTGFQASPGEFLKSFDIFVLASRKEGLGTSVLDAMSVGLPVIATRAGGIPEMVVHNENGILIPIGDSLALTNELSELVNNPIKRQYISANARASVLKFDINHTIDAYIDLYKELVNG